MTQDAKTLLPCPFCGSTFVAQGASNDRISVWCARCGSRGPDSKFPEDCMPGPPIDECRAAWNRRALQDGEATEGWGADWRVETSWPAVRAGYVICAFYNEPKTDADWCPPLHKAAAYIVTNEEFSDDDNVKIAEFIVQAARAALTRNAEASIGVDELAIALNAHYDDNDDWTTIARKALAALSAPTVEEKGL